MPSKTSNTLVSVLESTPASRDGTATPSSEEEEEEQENDEEPPRKRVKLDPISFCEDTVNVVTLIGGRRLHEEKYIVHLEVANASPVLRAHFENSNTTSCLIYELGVRTEDGAVRFLIQGLYAQKLTCYLSAAFVDHPDQVEVPEEDQIDLVDMWLLAQKLELPNLQNLALESIDALVRAFHDPPIFPASELDLIYNSTSEDSMLRKYLIAAGAHCLHFGTGDSGWKDSFTKAFLMDLHDYWCEKMLSGEPFTTEYHVSNFFVDV